MLISPRIFRYLIVFTFLFGQSSFELSAQVKPKSREKQKKELKEKKEIQIKKQRNAEKRLRKRHEDIR